MQEVFCGEVLKFSDQADECRISSQIDGEAHIS